MGKTGIKSVVRTMKAMAAANIGQYELAVGSLGDYYRTVTLSINTITPLVGQMLVKAQKNLDNGTLTEFYVFHNQPREDTGYVAVCQRLLPLDAQWKRELAAFT